MASYKKKSRSVSFNEYIFKDNGQFRQKVINLSFRTLMGPFNFKTQSGFIPKHNVLTIFYYHCKR